LEIIIIILLLLLISFICRPILEHRLVWRTHPSKRRACWLGSLCITLWHHNHLLWSSGLDR
jgi:hypothetical protein